MMSRWQKKLNGRNAAARAGITEAAFQQKISANCTVEVRRKILSDTRTDDSDDE